MVQDTASFQKLTDLAGRIDALKASIDDMKAGKVIHTDDVLAEMRHVLEEKLGR